MCTAAPAFEIVTSPAAVESASVFGLHYESGMHGAEVAREFRAAFKRAQKFGAFKGVKVSVTSDRFSGGSSVTVRVLAAPFPAVDRGRVAANIRGTGRHVDARADRMRLLVAQLQMLANLWRRDESDSSTDYFNCNCYLSVDVDIDDAREWGDAHAIVAAPSLRRAVEAIDALSPLADDRPALAVECLARGERAEAEALAVDALKAAAPASVEACLARAVVAVCERIARSPWEDSSAFVAAGAHVRAAVEAAGRTAEEARGVCDAAAA